MRCLNFSDILTSSRYPNKLYGNHILDDDEENEFIGGVRLHDNVLIDGEGHSIDARGKTRIFYITGKNVLVMNITFKNGVTRQQYGDYSQRRYGAAIYNEGDTTLVNCKFENNISKSFGGAITNRGKLKIVNCEFLHNHSHEAGAVFNTSHLEIKESNFISNSSRGYGGAITNEGKAVIDDCMFLANRCIHNGGAINNFHGLLEISNCTFKDNYAYKNTLNNCCGEIHQSNLKFD